MFEKILESLLDSKDMKQVHSKGNQLWIRRTDAEAEALILWPIDAKSLLMGKDLDAGKDWGQEKGQQDEMVGWHHWFSGHEFEQTLKESEVHGSLECCSPWVCKSQTQLCDWTTKYSLLARKQFSWNIWQRHISAFLQRRHTDSQKAHEKMLENTNYRRNAKQNDKELSFHTSQNDHHWKIYK